MWNYRGQQRPEFALQPGPGEESVWDYPRPPRLARSQKRVLVQVGDTVVADSSRAIRILETASPPTYYLPPEDVDFATLIDTPGSSFCEWKGRANYYALATGGGVVGWQYRQPVEAFAEISGFLSFYPGKLACSVDGERVRPQPGDFYGGWVTDEIVGPFKGDPGTGHW